MNSKKTITDRIATFYGFIGKNRITLREVAKEAGINYKPLTNALSKALKEGPGIISEERLNEIEAAAIRIQDRKKKVAEPV